MIVRPHFRGALCPTAHPLGCSAQVEAWVRRVRGAVRVDRPLRLLVIGASGGIGLAARIVAAFGAGGPSVGVAHARPGTPVRPGTAGWYRCVAFERAAAEAGLVSRTVIGDAFDDGVKRLVADVVAREVGEVDLVLYSIAAASRTNPRTGTTHRSVMKTVGTPFRGWDYHLSSGEVRPTSVLPATGAELRDTVAVMGGEDFEWWVHLLLDRGLLAPRARCVALSYVGVPQLAPTYRGGTLGAAKDDLERTAWRVAATLGRACEGSAVIAVPRALVTQSSVVIPMSTLYTALLMAVVREKGVAEDVLDQAARLVQALTAADDRTGDAPGVDSSGRLRLDDIEQRGDVQSDLWSRWRTATTESVRSLAAVDEFVRELYALYGFGLAGVPYADEVDPVWDCVRLVVA